MFVIFIVIKVTLQIVAKNIQQRPNLRMPVESIYIYIYINVLRQECILTKLDLPTLIVNASRGEVLRSQPHLFKAIPMTTKIRSIDKVIMPACITLISST